MSRGTADLYLTISPDTHSSIRRFGHPGHHGDTPLSVTLHSLGLDTKTPNKLSSNMWAMYHRSNVELSIGNYVKLMDKEIIKLFY